MRRNDLALLFLLLPAGVLAAEAPSAPFPIQRMAAADRLDAVKWEVLPQARLGDAGSKSFDGAASFAWDENYLLLRMRVRDESLRFSGKSAVPDGRRGLDVLRIQRETDYVEWHIGNHVIMLCPADGGGGLVFDALAGRRLDDAMLSWRIRDEGYECLAGIPWKDIDMEAQEGAFLQMLLRANDADGPDNSFRAATYSAPAKAEWGVVHSYAAVFLNAARPLSQCSDFFEPLFHTRIETAAYLTRARLFLTPNPFYGPMSVKYTGVVGTKTLFEGKVLLDANTLAVELPTGAEPGVASLELTAEMEAGAFGPTRIAYFAPGDKPLVRYRGKVLPPADFDSFWDSMLSELAAVSMDARAEKLPSSNETATVWKVRLTGWKGVPFYAFLSVPVKKGSYPLTMWVYPMAAVNDTSLKPQEGKIVLAVSPRGVGASSEFSAPPSSLYLSESGKPEDLYMLANILDYVRGIDYAMKLPETDRSRVHVGGGSRGGYLAWALAALDRRITSAYATVPCYADVEMSARLGNFGDTRDIVFGGGAARMREAWRYLDAVNFAHRIQCEMIVEAGMLDGICPAPGIVDAFSRIPSKRKILLLNPEIGHGHSPIGRHLGALAAGEEPKNWDEYVGQFK